MKFFYLRDENDFPVGCVCSHLVGDRVEFAVATWNPKDKFNREMARRVAQGRLEAGKKTSSVPLIKGERRQMKAALLAVIRDCEDYPLRARHAAAYWLADKKPPQSVTAVPEHRSLLSGAAGGGNA